MDEIRFDMQLIARTTNRKHLEKVSNTETRNRATEMLKRKDLYQIVRREICFGLIPKTLKRKLKHVMQSLPSKQKYPMYYT